MEMTIVKRISHVERHFTASDLFRDITFGMADGLTVPFALTAGLSGAVASTGIIVVAGLAEIVAGSISMGLGGYLATRSVIEHYHAERLREIHEINHMPEKEASEITQIFQEYGLTPEEASPVVASLRQRTNAWLDFMMRFELGLEKPDPKRAFASALTIALSYFAAGLIPLGPYVVLPSIETALIFSAIVTIIALAVFGFVKGRLTSATPLRSAIQTLVVGVLAGAAAFAIARAIS